MLERNAAADLAQQAGKAKLALLDQGKDAALTFGKPITITRNQQQQSLPTDARTGIFQADAAKLPAYVGATGARGGYAIYKVLKVTAPPPPDATRLAGSTSRVTEQVGRELFGAYMAALKARGDVKINQANLDRSKGDSEDEEPAMPTGGRGRSSRPPIRPPGS